MSGVSLNTNQVRAPDFFVCPFCHGELTRGYAHLECSKGTRFRAQDGILDLYLPVCHCGGTLKPIDEDKELQDIYAALMKTAPTEES